VCVSPPPVQISLLFFPTHFPPESETDISWAKEVSGVLYPLFVYLHLDLVHCGLKGAVDGFYGRFHGAFLQDGEQRATIEQLRHVLTAQDVAANPKLSAFLEHKYVVHLAEPAYVYLLRYLQSEDNSALCRALSTHLQVEVTASRRTDYQLYEAAGGATAANAAAAPNSASSWAGADGVAEGGATAGVEVPAGVPQSEAALETLQDCIKKVREGPPTLTTVCFYAFHHTEQTLNTAEVSADSRLLAAGFDSSAVKLWSLRARKLKAAPRQADVSLIHLACDVLEEEVSVARLVVYSREDILVSATQRLSMLTVQLLLLFTFVVCKSFITSYQSPLNDVF